MLAFLSGIFHVLVSIGVLFLNALVAIVNLVVAAVSVLLAVVFAALPSMPDPPGAPSSGVLQWLNWVLPLGAMFAGFGVFLVCWGAFLVIRVAGRWVKAL